MKLKTKNSLPIYFKNRVDISFLHLISALFFLLLLLLIAITGIVELENKSIPPLARSDLSKANISEQSPLDQIYPDQSNIHSLPNYDLSAPKFKGKHLLAIVIDDMGENLAAANLLCKLNFPVALSIIPNTHYARETAEIAHKAKKDILIHAPMQPINYPRKNPGPSALMSDMPIAKLQSRVLELIANVPYAIGVNNHMGSQLTRNSKAMAAICNALSTTGLFILDSVTHPASVFYNEARKIGLRSMRRNVFLDHVQDEAHVFQQLHIAEQIAKNKGQAIAIGHPLPNTLNALIKWQKTRDKNILIIPISQLP